MGRHPACCLILRIPIPRRTSLYPQSDAVLRDHRGLIRLSPGCPRPWGRLDTRYSPVRRSPSKIASYLHAAPRLACVKPVASVHPEPGSNSPLYKNLSERHQQRHRAPKAALSDFLNRMSSYLTPSADAEGASFIIGWLEPTVDIHPGDGCRPDIPRITSAATPRGPHWNEARDVASCTTSLSYVILSKNSFFLLPKLVF